MSLSFRRLAKDIAIYSAGDVLLRATAIITMPIYTRIFSVDDYGILSFVLTITGLLGAVLILGGDSAYARYYFQAKEHEQRRLVTSSWFGFLALWSCAVVALCVPLSGLFSLWSFGSKEEGQLFVIALLSAPVVLMNQLCSLALRNQFRVSLVTLLNFVTALLTICIALFAVTQLHMGLLGVLTATLVAALVMLPIRIYTVRDLLGLDFSLSVVRELLSFGLPLVPASLAIWVFMSSDRILLGKMSTLDQVGLFAVASSVASLLILINSAISQAWSPHAYRVYEEHPEQARVFYGQVMTYLLIGFGILVVGVTAFSGVLLRVLAAPAFAPAALAVGPMALGVMANATVNITALGITLTKKTKYLAMATWIAAGINVVLNLALIPAMGMLGSSWAMAVTYACLSTAYLLIGQRLWPVVYEKRRSLTTVGLTVIFTVGVFALPNLPLIEGIVLKAVYCLAFVVALVVARVVDRREFQALASLLPGRAAAATMAG